MIKHSRQFLTGGVRTATVLAGLMLASCVPQYSAPVQVQANNPSVTYKYHGDEELVQANQNAAAFCNRYQSAPQTASFATDPDGSKIVVFECVQTSPPPAPLPQINSNLTATYQTDQELLEASRKAQAYCMNNGLPQMISNIVTNVNGTKTVTFQCTPR
jgi:hypothetical protein